VRIGLDIGGTKTAALIVDAAGSVLHEFTLPTGYGADAVIETAVDAVIELARLASVKPISFTSIGVGIPGIVDNATGMVSHAVNLGLQDFDLAGNLEKRLGIAVHIENDVNAAAIGIFHLMGRPAVNSLAFLNLGTGLAAGLVLDGSLWRGSRGAAGEIGHIPIDQSGPLCACGQRGCLELMASGSGVARQWPTEHSSPVEALYAAALANDEKALEVWSRLVRNIAAAVRILVLTIDVEVIVIGGGISTLGEPLLIAVKGILDGWSSESAFLFTLSLSERVRLVDAEFTDAAAMGAALASQRILRRE
jgi:glucokinase